MIINFYASPTDCDALPNYKIEETTKEHSNFQSACRSLWCADSRRTLNPAPNFTLSIEIQKLPDITMQPILTQRFIIKSYLPNLNQIVVLRTRSRPLLLRLHNQSDADSLYRRQVSAPSLVHSLSLWSVSASIVALRIAVEISCYADCGAGR